MANFNAVKLFISTHIVLLWICIPLWGQDQPSNLDLADQTYYSILDSMFNGLGEPELKIDGLGREEEAFLRSGWIQFWSGKQGMIDSTALICVFDRFEFSVHYNESTIRLLGFSEQLTRNGKMALRGWIGKESGTKIVRAFKVSKSFSDSIDAKNILKLEQGPFTFLHGDHATRSFWTRYLEPSLVLISVTAIVYMFFSVRT